MTDQEIFDKVALHLLSYAKQGFKSVDDRGCLYRNGEGLSCAVGCLIPDDLYDPVIEHHPIFVFAGGVNTSHTTTAFRDAAVKISEYLGLVDDTRRLRLLERLQGNYDSELGSRVPTNEMVCQLMDVCRVYSLDPVVVSTFQ
jgi:hypothetical protein